MSTIFKAIKWGLIIWGLSHSDILLAYTNPSNCPDTIYNDGNNAFVKWNIASNGPSGNDVDITYNGKSYEFENEDLPAGVYKDEDGKAYDDGLDGIGSETINFDNGLQCNFFGGAVLPVEWASFESTVQGQNISLNWVTATEENNDFFTVERSSDAVHFTTIATIGGAGSSETMHTYNFIDNNPGSGNNYYRIRQTDFNGQYSYSQIVQNYMAATSFSLESMYPNPAINEINFSINNTNNQLVTLTIVDIFGNMVNRIAIETLAGIQNFNVNISDLSAGVYFVKISNDIEELSTRFVKH